MEFIVVKWLHVLSSTVLFGTGLGSAFYMYFASHSRDARVVAVVVRHVVRADWLFTAPTVVAQPVTGFYLLHYMGLPFSTRWITWSVGLFLLAIAAWLPVVWMQIRMRDMARRAVAADGELPAVYWRYLRLWVLLGTVAFLALVVVFYLMVAKPS